MPIDPTKRPDEQEIRRFVAHYEEVFSGALTEWAEADSYYLGEYGLWTDLKDEKLEATRPNYHSARAAAVIDQATDAISTFAPIITRPPTGKTKADVDAANRVENSASDLLVDSFVLGGDHAAKKTAQSGIIYNYLLTSVGLDTSGMSDKPVKRESETAGDFEERTDLWEQQRQGWNPLRIDALRPGEVLMDPMVKNPPVAVRRYRLIADDAAALSLKMAERQARRKRESTAQEPMFKVDNGKEYDKLDLIEFNSTGWWGVLQKTGSWLFPPEENRNGFQKWVHAWGGGGLTPVKADGFETKYMARGFLKAVMDDLRMFDQATAAVHRLLMRAAFARTGFDGAQEEGIQQMAGNLLTGPKDAWWTEVSPTLPPQVFQHMEAVLNDIRMGTFDPQVGGFRQAGIDTATQQILLSDASQRKFVVLNTQMGGVFSIQMSNMLHLAVNIMDEDAFAIDSLSVGANPLKKKDIGQNFRIFVTFENIDPVVSAQLKADARQELDARLTSREAYWKVARVSDTSTLRDEILDDEIDQLPALHQEIVIERMKQRGEDKLANKLNAELDQQALVSTGGDTLIERQPPARGGTSNGRA